MRARISERVPSRDASTYPIHTTHTQHTQQTHTHTHITNMASKTASNMKHPVKRSTGSQLRMLGLTDNFWEEGKYKRAVKRIEDGASLADDLSKMVQERCVKSVCLCVCVFKLCACVLRDLMS